MVVIQIGASAEPSDGGIECPSLLPFRKFEDRDETRRKTAQTVEKMTDEKPFRRLEAVSRDTLSPSVVESDIPRPIRVAKFGGPAKPDDRLNLIGLYAVSLREPYPK